MRFIVKSLLLLMPAVAAAQTWTPCGDAGHPCVISAQLSGNPCQILLGSQFSNVEVKPGVEVQWNISGASFFFIGFTKKSTVFGTNPFFVSQTGTTAKGTATDANMTSDYYIYAVDTGGHKCFLDPKIRTTSDPFGKGKKK